MAETTVRGDNAYTSFGIETGLGSTQTHGGTGFFGVQVGVSSVSAEAVVRDDGSVSDITLPWAAGLEISYKRLVSRDDANNKSNRIGLASAQDGRAFTLPVGVYAEWGEAGGEPAPGFGATIGPRLMNSVDRLNTNEPTLQLGAEVLAQIGTRKINGDYIRDMGFLAGVRLSVGSAENTISY